MSHNLVKANSKTADRASTISVELSDLSDVSTTAPTTGQALTWGGAQWEPTNTQTTENDVVAWVGGTLNTYAVGGNLQAGVGSFFYMSLAFATARPHYYHNQTEATWYSGSTVAFTSGAVWLDSVELTAGDYVLKAKARALGGSNPYVDVQWQTEAGAALSHIGRIQNGVAACVINGFITVTTTIKIGLRIIAKSSGSVAAPDSVDNEYLNVTILKV